MLGRHDKGIGGGSSAALAAIVFVALLVPAPADAEAATPHPSPAASAAFGVRGTNGFSLDVESAAGVVTVVVSERRPPVATFSRGGTLRPAGNGNGAASIYRVRGAGQDPREVDVELGRLGRIAVSFHPSGRTRVTRLGGDATCSGPTRIVRRLGTFRGTVEFRGEAGYTSVATTSAAGSVGTPLPSGCASASGARRDAVLSAVNRRTGTRFEAATTGSGAAFVATWRERLGGGVVVSRRAYAGAPRGSFSFDRLLTSARVAPPAPFSGTAHFGAGGADAARWTGGLRATFPGVAIPMTGPGFEARLGAPR